MGGLHWAGRLFFGTRRLLYVGPVLPTTEHTHHAHQILLAQRGPVSMKAGGGDAAEGRAFFIPAHVPHTITSSSPRSLILFVDADDREGRALAGLAPTCETAASWQERASVIADLEWIDPVDWNAAEALGGHLVQMLVGDTPRPPIQHPAVKRALRALPDLLRHGDVKLASVARAAGVSSSRLAHLFSAEVGLPMRPYVLWLRLHWAARAVAAGSNLTEAAHEAGFADSAHLARICRRMFGISPSQMALMQWIPPALA